MANPKRPSKITWIIGLVAGITGIVTHYVYVEHLSAYSFVLLLIGYVALAIGSSLRLF